MAQFSSDSIFWIETDKIHPNPYQPRREFDHGKLSELAESIRQYGVLQPLVATRKEVAREDGGLSFLYELIAGERRLRAARLAGLSQVPVVIRSGEDQDRVKLELAIIENLQREDLNPVDRARAFAQLAKDFKLTHSDIGRKIGKSREYVGNTIRLLALPDDIQLVISEGKLSEGHARPLLMLIDRPDEQQTLLKDILHKKLSVRETESISRHIAQDKVRKREYRLDPEILELERRTAERLGTRVQIEARETGGKIVIEFLSPEDLRGIMDLLNAEREKVKEELKETMTGDDILGETDEKESSPETDISNDDAEDLYSIRNFSI